MPWGLSGSSPTIDLKIGTPVATVPGAWRYRVSAVTGRPRVRILYLGEKDVAGTLSNQSTNNESSEESDIAPSLVAIHNPVLNRKQPLSSADSFLSITGQFSVIITTLLFFFGSPSRERRSELTQEIYTGAHFHLDCNRTNVLDTTNSIGHLS